MNDWTNTILNKQGVAQSNQVTPKQTLSQLFTEKGIAAVEERIREEVEGSLSGEWAELYRLRHEAQDLRSANLNLARKVDTERTAHEREIADLRRALTEALTFRSDHPELAAARKEIADLKNTNHWLMNRNKWLNGRLDALREALNGGN